MDHAIVIYALPIDIVVVFMAWPCTTWVRAGLKSFSERILVCFVEEIMREMCAKVYTYVWKMGET